jgi:hypothetical protein
MSTIHTRRELLQEILNDCAVGETIGRLDDKLCIAKIVLTLHYAERLLDTCNLGNRPKKTKSIKRIKAAFQNGTFGESNDAVCLDEDVLLCRANCK